MSDLLFGQRRFHGRREYGQNFSATRADREVVFALRNLVRLERLFMVRRDQFGVGTIFGVAVRKLVQGIAHPPRQRFFPAAVACFVSLL
jgi:hypothetical protein